MKRKPFYKSRLREKLEAENIEQWRRITHLRELLHRHDMFWAYGPMRDAYLNSTIWKDTQTELAMQI